MYFTSRFNPSYSLNSHTLKCILQNSWKSPQIFIKFAAIVLYINSDEFDCLNFAIDEMSFLN